MQQSPPPPPSGNPPSNDSTSRPQLTPTTTASDLRRWYWLKDELAEFARLLGLRGTGSKEGLSERIAAHLDGRTFEEPAPAPSANPHQLQAPLGANSVIPKGQRCSQAVRAWFVEQVGASFRFDSSMRDYFARSDGTQTLCDALEHWRLTRGQGERHIDAQFEYNRFTRDWHREHPQGTRSELLTAWRLYRSTPVEKRTPSGDPQ